MLRKKVFGIKCDTAVKIDFYFLPSPFPSFFAFLASFFISLAKHLVGFILVEKGFREAFRILELDERNDRSLVELYFRGNFHVSVTRYFAFFSGVLN